jgi:hypothetical protein
MAVQDEMRDASVAKIEELTGRTVLASFSQVDCDPELALEMFVLAPVLQEARVALGPSCTGPVLHQKGQEGPLGQIRLRARGLCRR